MSDNQKAIAALNLVLDNCKNGLIALTDGSLPEEEQPNVDFTTIRTDYVSILSLIYAASTKVALALKPAPSPHHKAALVPLKDLSNNTAALVHSIRLMRRIEGATLLAEYENVSRNVLTAVQSFANGLAQSKSESNDETFISVGKVHELIDNAKKPNVLSTDNRAAVKRRWMEDYGSLADGWEELQEIGKASDGEGNEDEGDFDDGWDELGLTSKQVYTPVELERVEKVRALVKLANLLHKRIVKDFLSSDNFNLDNTSLDRLTVHSGKLLSSSDELISSLYAPQQPSAISTHLSSYLHPLQVIRQLLIPQNSDLGSILSALSISNATTAKTMKWLQTCFEQIDKAGVRISETLIEPVETTEG